ncbi:hypothetical protein [Rothia uropygioeca]|uniref:hypothetical protein n=1 Tax=Kocuria sp. 257 TaxID=2021970 RepID=UPI0018746D57|nr:hypothetical protein [Kocuria sp. 257]
MGHQTKDPAVWSDDWTRHRVQGALILCPDHKDRAAVEEQLKATEGKPSQGEVEKKAVQVAYGTQPSTGTNSSDEYERDLETLKELCGKRYLGDTEGKWPWSESQRQEAKGAFVLCPDHQDRGEVEARWRKGEQADQGRSEGTRFGNGTFRVGQKIQPGTYQTETTASEGFSACYWERQDEAGNIIDNNFMSGALQAQVTIAPTDFAFMSRGCGEWHQ